MEETLQPHPSNYRRRHVVALPFPGRGHINPMLALCRRLASRGGSYLLITVVVTEEWFALLSTKTTTSAAENLRFKTIPNVLPSERQRGKDYMVFIEAVKTRMAGPVEELLQHHGGLEPPIDAIVADSMLPWVPAIGKKLDIPVVALFPQAAAVFLALLEFNQQLQEEVQPPLPSLPEMDDSGAAAGGKGKEEDALRYLPRGSSTNFPDITSNNYSGARSMLNAYIHFISWCITGATAVILGSFPELEPVALDKLRCKFPDVPIYSIACIPAYHDHNSIITDAIKREGEGEGEEGDPCKEFLDSQPDSSVLYVSLGSFLPVLGAEMEELAWGLRTSGCRFIWIVREDTTNIKDIIGRDTKAGLVVPWCNQLRVLCHPAVGGFLTHCGWNSILEGIYAGVPMLAYPLMWDQFPNRKLIAEDWGVGFTFKDEEEESGGFVVGREEIALAVRKLMGMEATAAAEAEKNEEYGGPCRETIMTRAMQLKEKSRATWIERSGGSSLAVDNLLHEILNPKKQNITAAGMTRKN